MTDAGRAVDQRRGTPPPTPADYTPDCVAERFDLDNYAIDYIPGGGDLVISFAHSTVAGQVRDAHGPPWGFAFLRRHGVSILGVKPRRNDWYRGRDIIEFFLSSRFAAVLARHDRHILYGGSMGGYAATAFAAAAPGCIVIAHNPQSTLDRKRVPWETRFLEGQRQDWTTPFADAAQSIAGASRVLVSYDPFMRLDRLQADRYRGDNIHRLKVAFVGHGMPAHLQRMGILGTVFTRFVQPGPPSAAELARLARARRSYPPHLVRLAGRLEDPRRAEEVLLRALRIDPGHAQVLAGLGRAWLDLGKVHEALVASQSLQRGGAQWRTPGRLLAAEAFERLGDLPRAFATLAAGMALAPNDRHLAGALVALAPKAGQVGAALALLGPGAAGPAAAWFTARRRDLAALQAEHGGGPPA